MTSLPLDLGVFGRPRPELTAAYLNWMPNLTTRADLTVKRRARIATPGPPAGTVLLLLNDDLLRASIVRAMNRLNGHVLRSPRSTKYRPRLDAMAWFERGPLNGRPHIHALIERPVFWQPQPFANAIATSWKAQPLAHRKSHVDEIRDIESSLLYNAKADRSFSNLIYLHKEPDESAWWRAEWLKDWNG